MRSPRRSRPAITVASTTPALSALASLPFGLPWPAAFALAILGILTGTALAWSAEAHRHAEYLATVDKASNHARLDVNGALHLLRGSEAPADRPSTSPMPAAAKSHRKGNVVRGRNKP